MVPMKEYTGNFAALTQPLVSKVPAEDPEDSVEFVQTEKMANLGLLLAGLAHEINNPASFAHNGALNLRRRIEQFHAFLLELAGEGEASEFNSLLIEKLTPMLSSVETVLDGVERIQEIVQNVQMFTRQDQPALCHDSIAAGLQKTLSLVQPTYPAISFVCEVMDNPKLEGWHFQLNQVFMNLAVNACQSISKRIEMEGGEFSPQLRVVVQVEDAFLQIRFFDNGCGISTEQQQRIFEPFFTTKSSRNGTGLGLAISQEIIELHKGKIKVESTPGKGSCFTVSIPF